MKENFQNNSICFVVVYNHRYEDNIEKIEKIYKYRFSNIFHLMPFYRGNKKNVIPVYESSEFFQGYFAQGSYRFIKPNFSHYVFIADDLLLNPDINENNLLKLLKLTSRKGYVKSLRLLETISFQWVHLIDSLRPFSKKRYINYESELPAACSNGRLQWNQLQGLSFFSRNFVQSLIYMIQHRDHLNLPYPLFMGYSDFVVVPSCSIREFCHLCGVFAAMGVFVETAIPTIFMLCVNKIVCESDIVMKGIEMWSREEIDDFNNTSGYNINKVYSFFNKTILYRHPIKLSKIKM